MPIRSADTTASREPQCNNETLRIGTLITDPDEIALLRFYDSLSPQGRVLLHRLMMQMLNGKAVEDALAEFHAALAVLPGEAA